MIQLFHFDTKLENVRDCTTQCCKIYFRQYSFHHFYSGEWPVFSAIYVIQWSIDIMISFE